MIEISWHSQRLDRATAGVFSALQAHLTEMERRIDSLEDGR